MRPGQETPDKLTEQEELAVVKVIASMRPGQETPDKLRSVAVGLGMAYGFNEAGARNPG